jgi:hypothetical protein
MGCVIFFYCFSLAYEMHLVGAMLYVVRSSSSSSYITIFVILSFHSVYSI